MTIRLPKRLTEILHEPKLGNVAQWNSRNTAGSTVEHVILTDNRGNHLTPGMIAMARLTTEDSQLGE